MKTWMLILLSQFIGLLVLNVSVGADLNNKLDQPLELAQPLVLAPPLQLKPSQQPDQIHDYLSMYPIQSDSTLTEDLKDAVCGVICEQEMNANRFEVQYSTIRLSSAANFMSVFSRRVRSEYKDLYLSYPQKADVKKELYTKDFLTHFRSGESDDLYLVFLPSSSGWYLGDWSHWLTNMMKLNENNQKKNSVMLVSGFWTKEHLFGEPSSSFPKAIPGLGDLEGRDFFERFSGWYLKNKDNLNFKNIHIISMEGSFKMSLVFQKEFNALYEKSSEDLSISKALHLNPLLDLKSKFEAVDKVRTGSSFGPFDLLGYFTFGRDPKPKSVYNILSSSNRSFNEKKAFDTVINAYKKTVLDERLKYHMRNTLKINVSTSLNTYFEFFNSYLVLHYQGIYDNKTMELGSLGHCYEQSEASADQVMSCLSDITSYLEDDYRGVPQILISPKDDLVQKISPEVLDEVKSKTDQNSDFYFFQPEKGGYLGYVIFEDWIRGLLKL